MRVENTFFRHPRPKPPMRRRIKSDKSFAELLQGESGALDRKNPESESRTADRKTIDLTA